MYFKCVVMKKRTSHVVCDIAGILNLQGNNFTGTIPTELEQLRQLEKLYLNENSLAGNVTDEFCDEVGYNMLYFEVDCGNISCECCTNCNTASRRYD